ncbi:hypothetical protein [Streptomyces roseolilacinus]|uniref:Secreted protein n=1 Tax=Streptomyces roseolilacinus TaxID=66904 RepID=A0A918EK42_9ACTN|nr:hypothetical protein [Streptomyces roseolilacinus]GGQ02232.1 hypothetical protein GCM10010249_20950 [Streptomyces roseolilacinus]
MDQDLWNIVLGVAASGLSASLGWLARAALSRRRLRRKQGFFGLPDDSDCLLVVNREAGGEGVHRNDVFALLELSALIRDCGAHARIVRHDRAVQGFGDRTEFCLGGPTSNQRMGAHLRTLLPGLVVEQGPGRSPDVYRIGEEAYRAEHGVSEYVVLARLTAGEGRRPVFLFCGQKAITNQAATRYLVRHHEELARRHGRGPFALLLKVVNSEAYGPDVVELVADVTSAATRPAPSPTPAPAPADTGDAPDTPDAAGTPDAGAVAP